MRYLILDTDTGVDDALAILYALGLEARGVCRLVGVTCTFGNVEVETAVKNSRAVLDFLGRRDIPVFRGGITGCSEAARSSYSGLSAGLSTGKTALEMWISPCPRRKRWIKMKM